MSSAPYTRRYGGLNAVLSSETLPLSPLLTAVKCGAVPDEPELGHSSGFAVEEDPSGGYVWSAFGPAGTRQGHAESQSQAEAAAREAQRELDRPR
jgi:hypothetical protein